MLTDATPLAQLARTPAMLMGRALPERRLDDRMETKGTRDEGD